MIVYRGSLTTSASSCACHLALSRSPSATRSSKTRRNQSGRVKSRRTRTKKRAKRKKNSVLHGWAGSSADLARRKRKRKINLKRQHSNQQVAIKKVTRPLSMKSLRRTWAKRANSILMVRKKWSQHKTRTVLDSQIISSPSAHT